MDLAGSAVDISFVLGVDSHLHPCPFIDLNKEKKIDEGRMPGRLLEQRMSRHGGAIRILSLELLGFNNLLSSASLYFG